MPSEQILREEAALVEQAIATDERAERLGGLGWTKSGIYGAAMCAARLVLNLLLIRWLSEDLLDDYIIGHDETTMRRELVEEVQEWLEAIPEEGFDNITRMVAAEIEGESPKPRGRTPRNQDWQSDQETTKQRLQLYPRKWDKGGEGGLWLGEPAIVVWVKKDRKPGIWRRVQDVWGWLLTKGADTERWSTKWWPTESGGWSPGLVVGGIRSLGWNSWENPNYTRKLLTRAIQEDPEYGFEDLDIIDKVPYASRKTGVNYMQYIFAPYAGVWSDIGIEFRKEMKKLGITVGISVAAMDSQPEDPCSTCTMDLKADGSCPAKKCLKTHPKKFPVGYKQGLIGRWLLYNNLRIR